MTPNDQFDADHRFRKLVEAVKFVWASTFFAGRACLPRDDRGRAAGREDGGHPPGGRRAPGTGRAFIRTFRASPARTTSTGSARRVRRTVSSTSRSVSAGRSWKESPPGATVRRFPGRRRRTGRAASFSARRRRRSGPSGWGRPADDPLHETEYLVKAASTTRRRTARSARPPRRWTRASDRLVPGTGGPGPRLLDFAPLLVPRRVSAERRSSGPLLASAEGVWRARRGGVRRDASTRRGSLRGDSAFCRCVRMAVSTEVVDLTSAARPDSCRSSRPTTSSETASSTASHDVVYLRPERFDATRTPGRSRLEIAAVNRRSARRGRRPTS